MTTKPVDNMVMLSTVSEEAVLECLKQRYNSDKIYTFISNVLIAVNPFRLVRKDLYSTTTMQKYKGRYAYENEPHVFTVAENAYRNLMSEKKNQSIIISGESGAGKTEASKQIMNYLAELSRNTKDKDSEIVKKQILESNPILEAFGNAKTVRNNNSSRFGKYMEIFFDFGGRIIGGNIMNFLLEKSRIVGQNKDERNFHVFYQLFTDDSLKRELKLGKVEDFFYLNQSGCTSVREIDDKQDFVELKSAMDAMGFLDEEQNELFRILAGILHLGNLTFAPKKQGSSIQNPDQLKVVSDMLKIREDALVRALTTRTVTAGGRQSVYNSELDVRQAEYARDALAKATYGKLFDWVVKKINSSILKKEIGKDRLIVGILDIYGFEIFEKNSFEQLCINFTNEKLQQIFIELTLKAEQEEYDREGIKWTPVKYENNKPCVDLIEKKIGGLFSLLNETCLMSGDDKAFLEKVRTNLKTNPFFLVDEKRKDVFGVKHYAGDVFYAPEGFTDKNSDQLFQSIVDTLKSTSNKLLKELFSELPQTNVKNTKNQVSQRPTSVSAKFVTQVDELMTKLYACSPHYVRCLKPNSEKRANYFVDTEMKHQIRYLGLLENIKVRRAGFVFRLSFDEFFTRFKVVSKETYPTYSGSAVEGCKIIMKAATNTNENYQFGKTKIFIKIPEVVYHLEELRDRALDDIVRKIQNVWKGYKARKFFIEMREKSLGIFGDNKKRRRISVNRVFAGDYLKFGDMVANMKMIEKAGVTETKLIYSNYGSKATKTLLGFGAPELHPRIIVMTEKNVLFFTGNVKKPTFKEKFEIATIEYITLSTHADNFVYIKTPGNIEYLLEIDSKTEFVSLLVEYFEKMHNKEPPNIQFLDKYIFYIKKKSPLNVVFATDEKCEKTVLKQTKTDLLITFKHEVSLFGRDVKNRSDKISTKKSTPVKKVVYQEKVQPLRQDPEPKKFEKPMEKLPPVKEEKVVSPRKVETKVEPKVEQKALPEPKRQPPPKPQRKEVTEALYDFDAENGDELTLHVGDQITVHEKRQDGWWIGEVNGKKGLFPAEYCKGGAK